MDFIFVSEADHTAPAMFGTYEGTTDEIRNQIEVQLEEDKTLEGTLIEIDFDTQTVFVDHPAHHCDSCGNYRFIAAKTEVVLGDGSVDDVFGFCADCIDSEN